MRTFSVEGEPLFLWRDYTGRVLRPRDLVV